MVIAPKKPMLEIIWAATRKGLGFGDSAKRKAKAMKEAEPSKTSVMVRSPTKRCRHWHSTPMDAPSPNASTTRKR